MSDTPNRKDEIVTIRLDTDTIERLRKLAHAHERTVSAEVRLAVRRYLTETEMVAA